MALFDDKAPWVMGLLRRDFSLEIDDAAAVLGNIGHECAGFTDLVESNSAWGGTGGIGWCQWTGQTDRNNRRREYEAYCRRNAGPWGLTLDEVRWHDRANYGWLFVELKTTERRAIPVLRAAVGLEAKTAAFMETFERPGVPHLQSRIDWARRAKMAFPRWDGTFPPWAGGGDDKPPRPVVRIVVMAPEGVDVEIIRE